MLDFIRNYKFIIFFSFAVLIFIAFYNGLVIRNYTVKSRKIPNGKSIRIVLISDLHSHKHGKNQSKIIDKIKSQNPDIIALAGDIADDKVPIEGSKIFLEKIKNIAPIYYVTGNHEIWSEDVDNIKETFKSYGVNVMENNYEELTVNGAKIIIAGVDDPQIRRLKRSEYGWNEEVYNSFLDLTESPQFKILLSHRPEKVDLYNNLPFDMVLSGHSHGGQVRIPFILNGLLAPNQGFFPKYAGGMYELDNFTLIVSRGVSFNLLLPRVFNPPEVVVIDVVGG